MTRSWFGAVLTIAVLAVAGFLLARTLGRYDLADIKAAIEGMDAHRLLGASLFAVLSYTVLTAVEFLAVRYAGRPLPYRQVALACFIALSIGHSLGFAALSSGAVRFRLYRRWGLRIAEIARVILYCGLAVLLGYSIVGGVALATSADWLTALISLPPSVSAVAGAVAFTLPVLYLAVVTLGRPIRIWRTHLFPPTPSLTAGQILLGCLDVALVAAVLHQALGGGTALPFSTVLVVYVTAAVAGMLAHAPGGIGVVEAVTLALLPGAETIAGLLAFRAIYYLVPLVLGAAAFALFEVYANRRDG
ncbi:MAG TPA: YbhN family protein [Alphaproteobacteria bacterium]|nr:YbhN family protein [Alphaproteobacteria bacterium]